MSTDSDQKTKIDLKPLEVGVGAGAAVVTAVASSYLGTAGTLTGAAVASVVGTVSTSVLRSSAERTNDSLQRTTARLRQTRHGLVVDPAPDPAALAAEDGTLGRDVTDAAGVTGPAAEQAAAEPAVTPGSGRRRPRWAVVAAGVVAAFTLALLAITGIEALAGKPLAAVVGDESGSGTTLNGTVEKEPAPSTVPGTSSVPTPSSGTSPTGTPSATNPTASPTGAPPAASSPTPSLTGAPPTTQPAPSGAATIAPTP